MLRAVLFDLDDTLYHREAALRRFAADQHERYEFATPADLYVEEFVALDARGRVWKDKVYAELKVRHNLGPTSEELLEDYLTWFYAFCVPFPGLRQVLCELKESGLKLALLTNGRSGFQQQTLKGLCVQDLFDEIIVSEEVNLRKPDPRIFQLTLDRLGIQPEQAIMFGDDEINDIAGAQAAGIRAVQVGALSENAMPASWQSLLR